jgi:hypothetical protein
MGFIDRGVAIGGVQTICLAVGRNEKLIQTYTFFIPFISQEAGHDSASVQGLILCLVQ